MMTKLTFTPLDTTVRPRMSEGAAVVGGMVRDGSVCATQAFFFDFTGDVRLRAGYAPAIATAKGLHVGARAWSPPV